MKKAELPKINIGQAVDIVEQLIPDTPPKTKAGRILRWIKSILKVVKILK